MILTDGTHLVSTESEAKLHGFAKKIGLQRSWYQDHPTHPHYDTTSKKKLALALKLGAVRVDSQELLTRAWWWKSHPMNPAREVLSKNSEQG